MRRRDLLAGGPASLLAASDAIAQSPPRASGTSPTHQVDVRRDFGAVGNGLANDWAAIETAGLYLERLGGGRLYFPTGRYRLPEIAKNITVRSNVEYYGDGHSSVIIGSNAAFISPEDAAFGRTAYDSYKYMPISDIVAGDQFIDLRDARDAVSFKPGDIVIARSINAIVTPGDILPYYVEMNRVVGVDGRRLLLEDPVDDGWRGLIVANVTKHIAQGYSIHDLRIECDNGYPFFIQGSYKSVIRNCWTRGYAVACFNAFTRSAAHDINATVLWNAAGTSASLFEVETGSVRANFHDIDVYMAGSSKPGTQFPLFYCQEFSRRTLIRNIRVAAAGLDVGMVLQIMSGGHRLENIEVTAKSIDKVLDYFVPDPGEYQLGHLGLTLANTSIETLDPANGFHHGFVLHNDHNDGEVQNVTISHCSLRGATDRSEHNLIWFYKGVQRNVMLDGVSGPGCVTMDPPPDKPYQFHGVVLRNCDYTHIASQALLDQSRFVACARTFGRLPTIRRLSESPWSSPVATPELVMTIPPDPSICRGDAILIELSGWYAPLPFPAYVQVKAMGTVVATLALTPHEYQDIRLMLKLEFVGTRFLKPDRYVIRGPIMINNRMLSNWSYVAGSLATQEPNAIELLAWIEKPTRSGAALNVGHANITFRSIEAAV
ncbi:glycosyl hydrolase family 28-related protein [Bradyrhizobium sp. USDA 3650]